MGALVTLKMMIEGFKTGTFDIISLEYEDVDLNRAQETRKSVVRIWSYRQEENDGKHSFKAGNYWKVRAA
jgi:hypothetical protein